MPGMKAKTELLLYRILWLAEKPMRPTFRNLEQSFEGWAYRSGLLAQIDRLEAQGLLESRRDPRTGERLHRLTEAGRLAAAGGRDPEAAWARKWDCRWRLFLFDVPESESAKRKRLTRALCSAGCGCLQGSVWIAPFAPPALEKLVSEDESDCSRLLLLHAESKGGRVDRQMVEAAWDFAAVDERYRKVMAVLERLPALARKPTREQLDAWTAEERAAWRAALVADPLLPEELLPDPYLGRTTWERRRRVLAEAGRIAKALREGDPLSRAAS